VSPQCHCGTWVDAFGSLGFVCKKTPSRSMRYAYQALNELVSRALSATAIPNTKERQGLCRSVIGSHWFRGKAVNLLSVTWESSALWSTHKCNLSRHGSTILYHDWLKMKVRYHSAIRLSFQPIAVETTCPINESACDCLCLLAKQNQRTIWWWAGDGFLTSFYSFSRYKLWSRSM